MTERELAQLDRADARNRELRPRQQEHLTFATVEHGETLQVTTSGDVDLEEGAIRASGELDRLLALH